MKHPAFLHRLFILLLLAVSALARAEPDAWPGSVPASRWDARGNSVMLASAVVGRRVIAVGEHGIIVSSSDGRHYTQARTVPVRSALTAVHFADEKRGWAVGYDGVILHTQDGGVTWAVQRQSFGKDDVLMGVWFVDPLHGFSVGMFGLAFRTADGGQTWERFQLLGGELADRHLYGIVSSGRDALVVHAESGLVVLSSDSGATWRAIETGSKASLWAAASNANVTIAVGLRGAIVRSTDGGRTWQAVDSGTKNSLTTAVIVPDGGIWIGGADGVLLSSSDLGKTFQRASGGDSRQYTSLAVLGSGLVKFPLPP